MKHTNQFFVVFLNRFPGLSLVLNKNRFCCRRQENLKWAEQQLEHLALYNQAPCIIF